MSFEIKCALCGKRGRRLRKTAKYCSPQCRIIAAKRADKARKRVKRLEAQNDGLSVYVGK